MLAADASTRAEAVRQCDRAADELCDFILFATLNQTYYADTTPVPFDDLATAKSALRQYLFAVDADQLARVHDAVSFDRYSEHLIGLLADDEWICSASSDEWATDLLQLSDQWLKQRTQYPNRNSAAATNALDAMAVGWQFEHHRKISMYKPGMNHRSRRWDPTAAGFERLEALSRKLGSGNDGVLIQYGQLCHLAIAVTRDGDFSDRMNQDVGQYIKAKEAEMSSPVLKNRPDIRLMLYHLMVRADQMLDQTKWARSWSNELMNFALSRHEVDRMVMYRGIGGGVFEKPQGLELDRRTAGLLKISAEVRSPTCVLLNSSKEEDERFYTSQLERLLEAGQRSPAIVMAGPGQNNRKLIDVFNEQRGLQWVFSPIVEGRSVYAVGVAHVGPPSVPMQIQLLRMSLDSNTVEKLPGISIDDFITKQGADTRSIMNPMFITDSCLANGRYCAATWRHGLVIFPTDGRAVETIDEHSGLPTNSVRTIASLDGKVYAGLGMEGSEGYIVCIDPGNKGVDVLASGVRKQKQSPFDDDKTFEVRGLAADPPRNRLIVAVQRYEPTIEVNGLWEFKPATRQWRQLLPMHLLRPAPEPSGGLLTGIHRLVTLSGDRVLIVTDAGLYVYDLAQDRVQIIVQQSLPDGSQSPLPGDSAVYKGVTVDGLKTLKDRRISGWGETTLIGGWLWDAGTGSRPWGRCNLKTGQSESFTSLRENPYRFVPHYFRPIGDGSQVLVGDDFGFWIVDASDLKK